MAGNIQVVKLKKKNSKEGNTFFEGFLPEGFMKSKQKIQITAMDDHNIDSGILAVADKSPSNDGSLYLMVELPERK